MYKDFYYIIYCLVYCILFSFQLCMTLLYVHVPVFCLYNKNSSQNFTDVSSITYLYQYYNN